MQLWQTVWYYTAGKEKTLSKLDWFIEQSVTSIDNVLSNCCFRYFSLQATHPLNFRDHIRIDLEVNICREGGPLPSCFNAAQKIAFEQMEVIVPMLIPID